MTILEEYNAKLSAVRKKIGEGQATAGPSLRGSDREHAPPAGCDGIRSRFLL